MTKSEITNGVKRHFPYLSRAAANRVVDTIVTTMSRALAAKMPIELRGFGTFRITKRKGSKSINPKNGQPMVIPDQNVVRFRLSKNLARRFNETGRQLS